MRRRVLQRVRAGVCRNVSGSVISVFSLSEEWKAGSVCACRFNSILSLRARLGVNVLTVAH